MMAEAPSRTDQQRLNALRAANEVRVARAEAKRLLKRRELRLSDLLEHPPAWLSSARLTTVLGWVPRVGPGSIDRLLLRLRISQTKTVAGLTERQRTCLVRDLAERGL